METLATDVPSNAALRQLVDRQDIYDCIKRISRAIDRFDRDLFLSAYHPDAVIDAGSIVADPQTAYAGGRALHEAAQTSTLHHLTNHSCEVEGDTAHCETYFLYAGKNNDGSNWIAGGRYLDRLERRSGEWRIAFRHTIIEWSGSMQESSVPLFDDVADRYGNGMPSRDRSDPSYRRPMLNLRAPAFPDNVEDLGRVDG